MQSLFLIFLVMICIPISYAAAVAADFLQNPSFEIPPPNITTTNNSSTSSQKWVANSIPGWSLNGTVWYVASDNGSHALQLGLNGSVSQKVTATGNDDLLDYVLSFKIAAQSIDCANNNTAINVTLRDSYGSNVSRVLYLLNNSSGKLWERHSLFLGRMGRKDYVNINIKSIPTTSSQDNVTCWPLVDTFAVNRNELPRWYNGNFLSNGGFEVGPAFVRNSGDGIILNESVEEEKEGATFYSPLQDWLILGNIRYIDSKHYKVPRGGAAVELLSGNPSGVQKNYLNLQTKYRYSLNFTIGDSNDGCFADFTVYVQIGPGGNSVYNFTMKSNGSGSAFKQTLKFRVDQSSLDTSITFYTLNETRTKEGLLCGPVLDDIFLTGSFGARVKMCNGVLLFIAFVVVMIVLL